MHPRRSFGPFSMGELAYLLTIGLLVGAALATLVVVGAGIMVWQSGALAAPTTVAGLSSSGDGVASLTPPATLPPKIVQLLYVLGGKVSTHSDAVVLSLATGYTVVVDAESELELTQLPSADAETRHTLLTLLKGKILVKADLREGDTFLVRTPNGDLAQVVGSVMGAEFDPETGDFGVACVEGHCRIGHEPPPDSGTPSGTFTDSVDLTDGESSQQDPNNPPSTPESSGNTGFEHLDEFLPTNTPEPATSIVTTDTLPAPTDVVPPSETPVTVEATTPAVTQPSGTTPTPGNTPVRGVTPATPNAAATRAAFCANFSAQFPGTPCP